MNQIHACPPTNSNWHLANTMHGFLSVVVWTSEGHVAMFCSAKKATSASISVKEAVLLAGSQDPRRWKPPDFTGLIILLPQIIGILKEPHKLCAKLNCIYHSFFDTVTKSKGDWKKEINLRKKNWYEVWLCFFPLKWKLRCKLILRNEQNMLHSILERFNF